MQRGLPFKSTAIIPFSGGTKQTARQKQRAAEGGYMELNHHPCHTSNDDLKINNCNLRHLPSAPKPAQTNAPC